MKSYGKIIRKYLIPSTVLAICLYALFLRLIKLQRHTLWNDEYYQLNQMLGSFMDLLKSLRYGEYCSYLSGELYLIFPFFKLFYYNKWGLAIPHIITTAIGFYLLYLICKRYFQSVWGYIVAFSVVCLNVNLIEHATEIRTYAVLPTLALGTFYTLDLFVNSSGTVSKKEKIVLAVFLIFVIWFHIYGILMFFSSLLFLLLCARKSADFREILKKTLKFIAVVLSIAMPFWIYSVFGEHLASSQYRINVFQFIPSPSTDLPGFLKGVFGNLVGYKTLYFLLIGLFFPFFFAFKERANQIFFLLIMVLSPILLMLFSDIINRYWFIQRQFLWIMPLFAFFLGWSWDSLLCRYGK